MRNRVGQSLQGMCYGGSVEKFRSALKTFKDELFAGWSIDELCFTRDETAGFCQHVKKRLGANRLTRPFILRSLVGTRKNRPRPAKL